MKYLIHILVLSFFCVKLQAGDTTKMSPRYIVEGFYSNGKLTWGSFKYDIEKNNAGVQSFDLKLRNTIALNFNYLLSRKSKTAHQIYAGLCLNYTQYDAAQVLCGEHSGGMGAGSMTVFSQDHFNYQVNNLNIGPNISYELMFKRLILLNRLGFYYSKNTSTRSYTYQQQAFEWGYFQDSSGNYYYSNKLISSDKKTAKIDDSSVYPFYQLGLGFRFKGLMPSANIEVGRISKDFGGLYARLQFGVCYLIR